MKTKFSASIITLCILASSISNAAIWVATEEGSSFNDVSKPSARVSTIDVAEATSEQVSLGVALPGFYQQAITMEDGIDYDEVILPGAGKMPVGQPDVPAFGQWVLVPNGTEIEISVEPGKAVLIEGYNIPPVQPPQVDSSEESPPFTKDEVIYETNADYPTVFARTDGIRTIRGQSSALVWLFPYQWNPVSKELKIYPNLKATVTFIGEGKSVEQRLRTPAFDNLFRRITPNADAVLALPPATKAQADDEPAINEVHPGIDGENYGGTSNGCDVLIICPDIYLDAARTLADWKCKRGLITEICTTTETGNTTNDIRNYISNAYSNWSPAPSYVLLIGDADQIPVWYGTVHPSHSSKTATDLFYVDMDTPYDRIADLAVGRWPVDTEAQAMACALRAVEYEQSPPDTETYSHFYTNTTQCGAFQDGSTWWDGSDYVDTPPDHYADRRFAKTSEDIRAFLLNEGFNPERIYATYNGCYYDSSTIYPTYWTTVSEYNFENDTPGAALPAELLKPTFAWDGTSADIETAVNHGTFLITHRDHGNRTGWGEPDFDNSDVDALLNGVLRPIVFTINCQTAWFDNETDASGDATGSADECFSEHWIRHSTGGSIGLIGATRNSFSGHNDRLIWGWMDAIWPDFIEFNGGSYSGAGAPTYRMGDVLNYGKNYFMTKYIWGDPYNDISLEEFVWIGDPSLEIWTGLPGNLVASHPATQLAGTSAIDVSVDQDGALVCCVFDDRIVGTATVAGSTAHVTLNPVPSYPGILHITVTKHDYVPYSGSCIVYDPNLPLVTTDGTANNITATSADAGGTVLSEGASAVTMRGICWSESPHPTTADHSTTNGSGTGHFTAALTGLDSEQSYFARAYAANSHGTAYGDPVAFTTLVAAPYVESFESGLGKWANASGDDIDWSLNSGSTPSSSTGPDGAQDGSYYLYTEASGYATKTAHLDLEVDVSDLTLPTLSFYYHMYGASMGSLHVDVFDGTWHLNVWSVSGQQHSGSSDAWTQANVSLLPYAGAGTVTLRIRGITGSSYTSDVAIDNVGIVDNTPHLDHFTWSAIADPQAAGIPFAVEITARDQSDAVFESFSGSVQLSAQAEVAGSGSIVLGELYPGDNDAIELVNVSNSEIDISGWKIIPYDWNSWPAPSMTFTVPTGTTCPAGDVFVLNESGTAPGSYPNFYSGANIYWNNNASGNELAVLLLDESDNIVDFACAVDGDSGTISNPMAIPGDEWSGLPIAAITTDTDSYQRIGSSDNNDSGDWNAATASIGTLNTGMNSSFGADGGVGIIPTHTGTFTAGVWSGSVTIPTAGTNVVLFADNGSGQTGTSGIFDVLSAVGDSDGDGIADWWEIMYFGDTASCIATNHGDGDVHNNRQEYIAGMDPTNAGSCFMVTNYANLYGSSGFVVEWVSVAGRSYNVLWSPSLAHGSFTPVESGIEYPRNSCTDTLHSTENKCFYEVEVQLK